MKTIMMNDLTMDYVMMHLMHEMLQYKENEPKGKNTAKILRQIKGNNLFPLQGAKSYFYCGKPYYITCFCYKSKNKGQGKTKKYKR